MDLKKYWATRYGPIDKSEFAYFDRHHSAILASVPNDARVLEIWPGSGTFAVYVCDTRKIPHSNYTLLDGSASVVENLARQELTKDFPAALSDIMEFVLRAPDGSYDFIVLRHIMEHLDREYVARLVPQLDRLLSRKGKILVEVPNYSNFPLGTHFCFADFSHVTVYTHETLVEMFLWHFDSPFDMRVIGMYPIFKFSPNPVSLARETVVFILKWISISLSFVFVGTDRFRTGKVTTPFMMGVVDKNVE